MMSHHVKDDPVEKDPVEMKDTNYSVVGVEFLKHAQSRELRIEKKLALPRVEIDCKVQKVSGLDLLIGGVEFDVEFNVSVTWRDASIADRDEYTTGLIRWQDHFIPNISVLGQKASSRYEMSPPDFDPQTGRCSMNGYFRGSIVQDSTFNMREFPFDVQNLCIIFEMKPCEGGNVENPEFAHPKHESSSGLAGSNGSIRRPHYHGKGVDGLLEWAILRVQGLNF
jgi:hypothetical protein